MPVMSLKTFKDRTWKMFSIRNGAIGEIDKKLKRYHDSGRNRATLLELRDAVAAFKTEKDAKFSGRGGDYTSSKRDQAQGVTDLAAQVAGELTALGPPMGVSLMGAGMAQEVRLRAVARQQNIELNTTDVRVDVSQRLDYRNGSAPTDFAWTVHLKLTEAPTELIVTVALKTVPTAPLTRGNFKAIWQQQIGSSWNGAKLVLPNGRTLPMRFELDWKANGYTGPAYTVNVHEPPPRPAQGQYARTGTGQWTVNPGRGPTVGTDVGTPHMGQWGADDRAAIVHEFGHMLGCPDEYYTVSYNGLALPAATYDQVPFTTDSIMNNTGPEGRIFPRHYQLIKQEYERWKGIAANTTRVVL